ncbi:hypothetical protein MJ904_09485 [Massilia sp. MB5]|uniref:hypothetical protein n=1 Tax=Massilia sp. MB5 TaxID=2919578 RepID=UPI001F11228C|nr:hypothetical protein [Massilia sp. MB5]UMR32373.1 hypothetical protein MJ904_09485 [Massilia sp. MB5]
MMTEQDRTLYFVLLRAFDRMTAVLLRHKLAPPEPVPKFLDIAWKVLGDDPPSKVSTSLMADVCDAHIVDEQDAGSEEILLNMYLYALSDFCMYFASGEASSLDAAQSSVLDFYDFIASQRYLADSKGGRAVAFTDADEEAIRKDPEFSGEIRSQEADWRAAQGIDAWGLIAQLR